MKTINDPITVEFIQTRNDGAGTVRLIASSLKQKVRLFDHFKIFNMEDPTQMIAMAEAMQSSDPYIHELNSKEDSRDNRGWFLTTATLDIEWTKPYFDLLNKRTGFLGRGILPDIDLIGADGWQNISHTHFTKQRRFEHGHFIMEIVHQSQDWNNKTASERTFASAIRQAKHEIAQTIHETEFIENNNGTYSRNPRYANGVDRWQIGVYSDEIWWALCDWWLETHANDAQKACVAASQSIHFKNVRGTSDLHNNKNGYNMQYDWRYPALSWEQFQNLTEFPIPNVEKDA